MTRLFCASAQAIKNPRRGRGCKSTFQGVSLNQSPIISNNSLWHAQASSSVKAGCISNSTPNIARQGAKCLNSTMLLSALQITTPPTTGLRAVSAADQLEAVNVITFCAASHVLNQLGVSSLLPFDLRELPSDVVKLHLFSKVKPPSSTDILNAAQRRRLQPA